MWGEETEPAPGEPEPESRTLPTEFTLDILAVACHCLMSETNFKPS